MTHCNQARYIDGGAETAVKIVKIDAGDDWAAIQQEVSIFLTVLYFLLVMGVYGTYHDHETLKLAS